MQKRLFNQIDESECTFECEFAVYFELERNFLIHFLCPVEVCGVRPSLNSSASGSRGRLIRKEVPIMVIFATMSPSRLYVSHCLLILLLISGCLLPLR